MFKVVAVCGLLCVMRTLSIKWKSTRFPLHQTTYTPSHNPWSGNSNGVTTFHAPRASGISNIWPSQSSNIIAGRGSTSPTMGDLVPLYNVLAQRVQMLQYGDSRRIPALSALESIRGGLTPSFGAPSNRNLVTGEIRKLEWILASPPTPFSFHTQGARRLF
jgi:hypothetical protein